MSMLLPLVAWLQAAASIAARRVIRNERGQATAEYALVMLGAAAVAVLVIAWAAKSGAIGDLLEKVFTTVTQKIK